MRNQHVSSIANVGEKYTTGQYNFHERSKFDSISIIIDHPTMPLWLYRIGRGRYVVSAWHDICWCRSRYDQYVSKACTDTSYVYIDAVYTNETYSDNLTYAYADYRNEIWCINVEYMIHQSSMLFPHCLCWCCLRKWSTPCQHGRYLYCIHQWIHLCQRGISIAACINEA